MPRCDLEKWAQILIRTGGSFQPLQRCERNGSRCMSVRQCGTIDTASTGPFLRRVTFDLSFILNTPGSGCVDALGSAGFTESVHLHVAAVAAAVAAAGRPEVYATELDETLVDESEAESILEGWGKAWLDGIEEATKDLNTSMCRGTPHVLSKMSLATPRIGVRIHAIGYALVVVFCFVFFIEGLFAQSRKPPGPVPAILATIVCILSTAPLPRICRVLRRSWVEVQRHDIASRSVPRTRSRDE